jgi:fructokinase
LLWDLFPDGPRLGGAPFNVIANVRRLGHPAAFLTAVGDDELGREAMAAADALEVDTTFISVSHDLPTGTVEVIPDPVEGHRFKIGSPAAYESIGDPDAVVDRMAAWRPGAVVFGTLAQRSAAVHRVTRQTCLGIAPGHRFYDMNLRDGTWSPELVLDLLGLATVVKGNVDEARVLGALLRCEPDAGTLGPRLAQTYGVVAVCVTRGGDGAALWADGALVEADGLRVDVVDTVGAGDAFAAGLLHAMLVGRPPKAAIAFANRLGALVASRPGALPKWRPGEIG